MGLVSGMMGNASEVDVKNLQKEFENLLVHDEKVVTGYKLIRDLLVVTDRRLFLVNKQGVTGKKTEYMSIPFAKISQYALETAGHLDLDSEVKIWVQGQSTPLEFKFKKSANIDSFYQVLSEFILR